MDKKNVYVNIGCGNYGKEGWINFDGCQHNKITYQWDCKKDIPLEDNAAKGIFMEHFFEHLDRDTEAIVLIKECYRVLCPGGIIRIIVPDAGKYLMGYNEEGWDYLIKTRPLINGTIDYYTQKHYQTKMELVNEIFRQSYEHKYAYDYETLELILKDAGFSNVTKQEYGKSIDSIMAIDIESRKTESLYIEAIK